MAESTAFDVACERLEATTSFNALEARGTIRLALRDAGLEPKTVTPSQLCVVIERVLPKELEARGIPDPAGVCRRIADALAAVKAPEGAESPETVFGRLGGR